jgi:nitroreductase
MQKCLVSSHYFAICMISPVRYPSFQSAKENDVDRRKFLLSAAATSGAIVVTGCGAGGWKSSETELPQQPDGPYQPWDALRSVEKHDHRSLAAAAILASSPHNTQPWRISVKANQFELKADVDRHLGAFDPYRREMWIGLGAAVANAETIATQINLRTGKPRITTSKEPGGGSIRMSLSKKKMAPDHLALFISERRTNRAMYHKRPVAKGVLNKIASQVQTTNGARFSMIESASTQGRVFADATFKGTKAINNDTVMSQDGHAWFRSNAREIAKYRDGTSIRTAGLAPAATLIGQLLPKIDAEKSGQYWLASTKRQLDASGGFGFIFVDDLYDRAQQIAAGQLWQRLHLAMTAEGIAAQPMNQLPELVDRDRVLKTDRGWSKKLDGISTSTGQVTFAFRYGYQKSEVPHSARRPLEWLT